MQALGTREVQVTCADAEMSLGKHQGVSQSEWSSSRLLRWDILTCARFDAAQLTAMSVLRHLPRPRQFVCRSCIRQQHTLTRGERPKARWADEEKDVAAREAQWEDQAGKVRSGMQQSMLSLLEERGFVKDVAG
jgi:hypothetical protein